MILQSPNGTQEDLEVSEIINTLEIEGENDEDEENIIECQYCFQTRLEGCLCEEEEEEEEEEDESDEDEEEEECKIKDSYFDPGVRRYVYRED